jgi:hypothetical protein
MRSAFIAEKGGYRDSRKEENFLVSHAASPFRSPRACCRLPSILRLSVNSLGMIVSSVLWMEEIFIKSHVNVDNFHWYETSKPR